MLAIGGVIRALATKLRTDISQFEKVYEEFPRANERLLLPSASITTMGTPEVTPRMRTVARRTPIPGTKNGKILYNIGQYNLNLQLDIWTEYKRQRESFYDLVQGVFDGGLTRGQAIGLTLEIPDHFNIKSRYEIFNYRYMDSPEAAQKSNWRLIFDVMVNFPRVHEVTQPLITDARLDSSIDPNRRISENENRTELTQEEKEEDIIF